MTIRIGCDIIEINRIRKSIQEHGSHFLDRIFSRSEQEYCKKYRDSTPHYAVRFAAKEAIVKALGTGISTHISWLDIEILNDELGKPHVSLSLKAQHHFNSPDFQLSMSHCKEYAMAVAVC